VLIGDQFATILKPQNEERDKCMGQCAEELDAVRDQLLETSYLIGHHFISLIVKVTCVAIGIECGPLDEKLCLIH